MLTQPSLAETAQQTILTSARRVLAVEQAALNRLSERLDERFVQAVQLIENLPGRVVVTGMGKSGHVGRKIAATLSSTGTPAYFLHPAEGRHGDLGAVTPLDGVIAISSSGETEELLGLLPTLKRLGVPIIALTGQANSTLAKQAEVVLDISVEEEACPLGLAPTASTTVTLALGDALAVALLERKGFKPEDFALFHPAGSLGKRLLLHVKDVMHTGEGLPVCHPQTPFLQGLMEMSAKKLGMTLVLDESGQLLGVVTDGDIRRALQRFETTKNLTVAEVMSAHPKTIGADELAVTALRQMEAAHITTLVVTQTSHAGQNPKPIGVLHLHDLLQLGLH